MIGICATDRYEIRIPEVVFGRRIVNKPGSEGKMVKEKIDRINELAHKSKREGLTESEKDEQTRLRNEYRSEIRMSLSSQLENTYIVTPDGVKHKAGEKRGRD